MDSHQRHCDISGVTGFTAANGSFVITVVDPTHFTLNGTTTAGSGTEERSPR